MTQKDYDRISHIKEEDFKTIMTAVQGGVDWESILICMAKSEYEYAIDLMSKEGYDRRSVKDHELKADKMLHYLDVFRRLNA